LALGQDLQYNNIDTLTRNLEILERGNFEDSVYERYRTMLISRIQRQLKDNPEPQ
jgi:hypothetical protein